MSKRLVPMVKRPSINPLKYYDGVGDYLVALAKGRRVAVIRQRGDEAEVVTKVRLEDGSKMPLIINDKEDLVRLVRSGALDFMASIGKVESRGIDTVIIDVKGEREVWLHEKGLLVIHVVAKALLTSLGQLGLVHCAVVFDGMNGFKLMAPLSSPIEKELARALLELVREASLRGIKHVVHGIDGELINKLIIGGNTMLKIGMFRLPFSIHWSTKLAAIPTTCIKDFLSLEADPRIVLNKAKAHWELLSRGFRENDPAALREALGPWLMGNYSILYRLKEQVRRSLELGCQ